MYLSNQSTETIGAICTIIVMICVIAIIVANSKNIWGKYHYTDEFNRATKNFFIRQKKKKIGLFTDSFGNTKIMSYYTFIGKDHISFRIWEDEERQVKNRSEQRLAFDFKCLPQKGDIYYCVAFMEANSGEIEIGTECGDYQNIIKLLKENKSLRIKINNNSSEYSFTLARGNFVKLYEAINK